MSRTLSGFVGLIVVTLEAMPWFDRPGANKDKINQEALKYGTPTGETTQDVRSVDGTAIEGQAVPDRPAADQPDAPSPEVIRKRNEFRELNRGRLARFSGTILSTKRTSERLARSHPDGKRGDLTPEKFVETVVPL